MKEIADTTYFGDGHSFTVSGDPEQLHKMAAYISDLKRERAGLIEQLGALRRGLESLKGMETVTVENFETTRIISYAVLNRKIDAILASNPASSRYGHEMGTPVDLKGNPFPATASGPRCDEPGCQSLADGEYAVGLGGMPAFYCAEHAPASDPHWPDAEGNYELSPEQSPASSPPDWAIVGDDGIARWVDVKGITREAPSPAKEPS